MIEFPDWTPPVLVEYYNRNKFFSRQETQLKIAIALGAHKDMESVWPMLYKKRRRYINDNVMAGALFRMTIDAAISTQHKITTRSESVAKYQGIAKSARELSEKIKNSAVDFNIMELLSDEAIKTMLELDINPKKAEGYFCLINEEGGIHKKGGIYSFIQAPKVGGGESEEYWREYESTSDFFKYGVITPQHPPISVALNTLAIEADGRAKHEATKPRLASSVETSKVTIFIRALYSDWIYIFGSPLYRTFAALCRAVFDDPSIDEDNIKNAIKGYAGKKV